MDVIKATCILHNLIQKETTPAQALRLTRKAEELPIGGMDAVEAVDRPANRGGVKALRIYEIFKNYMAPLDWQEAHVTRGQFTVE